MRWCRFVLAAFIAGVAGQILHGLCGGILARFYLMTPELFREFSPKVLIGYFIVNLFMGLVLALVFYFAQRILPGTPLRKGLIFGITVWLVTSIAGNATRYLSSPIVWELALGETLEDFVVYLVQGVIIAFILVEENTAPVV